MECNQEKQLVLKIDNPLSKFAVEKAASAWQTPETESINMDPRLATAFAHIIDEIREPPAIISHSKRGANDKVNTCRFCAGSSFC